MKTSIIITLAAISLLLGWRAEAQQLWPVNATGQVTCYGQALQYVKILLKDDDPIIDDLMGTTRTDSNGTFSVSGSGRDLFDVRPEPYIRVAYDLEGYYGKMTIRGLFNVVRSNRTAHRTYNDSIDFGIIDFQDDHCWTYLQFYKVIKDYRTRVGSNIPFHLNVTTNAIIHGGTPYAPYRSVLIPDKSQPIGYSTALHEVAHTVRHHYDGTGNHFLYDAVRFLYPRIHHCGLKTNLGFAFNEGWAQFWAGSCQYGIFGTSSTDYRYEGNVAQALRRLQKKCGTSDGQMVDVLEQSGPKSIHGFEEYNKKHKHFFKGCGLPSQ